MSRMESPLGRVYGLGSAREGAREWWATRITSVALIPLSLWWVSSVIGMVGADYDRFTAWVRTPSVSILLLLTLGATFYHTAQGLQVVIEDYVHAEWLKISALMLMKFACVVLAVAGMFSVLRIAFGS